MLSLIWFTFFYQPLFNALIWIYANVAGENLGWAVVWLTVILRVILLPLTIASELTAARREKANEETSAAIKAYRHDPLAQKAAARKIARKYHISPWAKVVSLGIQLLVLFLLYQVFIRGITGDKMIKILYPSIDFPGRINTLFYGFEVGKAHDIIWPMVASLYLP
jgi:membrane protein insertase Oxa1/YidC/SpoIIIJ